MHHIYRPRYRPTKCGHVHACGTSRDLDAYARVHIIEEALTLHVTPDVSVTSWAVRLRQLLGCGYRWQRYGMCARINAN